MRNYFIYVNGKSIGESSGYQVAWAAYHTAIRMCELLNADCCLVDAETGEVIDTFERKSNNWKKLSCTYPLNELCWNSEYKSNYSQE